MKICIDPGHGGEDPGAIGNEFREKDINLTASLMLAACLNAKRHDVRMTRIWDKTLPLPGRIEIANDAQADCFISVHCNGFDNPNAHGLEVYHHPGSERGKVLAHRINEKAIELDYIASRGVKYMDYYVLVHTAMPAVLVELGFVTNDRDIEYLTDNMCLFRLMRNIAEGFR